MGRRADLENLVSANGNITFLIAKVAAYQWDIHEELVELSAAHVIRILSRYISGELTNEDVVKWANAVESREDIAIMGASADGIRQSIHELANPLLGYELNATSAQKMILGLTK